MRACISGCRPWGDLSSDRGTPGALGARVADQAGLQVTRKHHSWRSSSRHRSGRTIDVRYERLVIEAGEHLHPRPPSAPDGHRRRRRSSSGRPDRRAPRALSEHPLRRPPRGRRGHRPPAGGLPAPTAPPRVVDVDRAPDVTSEFADADGRHRPARTRAGLDRRRARRKLRFSAADLPTASQVRSRDRRTRRADQTHAVGGRRAPPRQRRAAPVRGRELGSAPEDAEIIERVEQRHRRFELSNERHDRCRQQAIVSPSTVRWCADRSRPGRDRRALAPAAPRVASRCSCRSLLTRSRRAAAARAEEQRPWPRPAPSRTSGFHLQRVNGLLSSSRPAAGS